MPARLAPVALAALHRSLVVTPALLRSVGLNPRLADRETKAGRWQRVALGIYLPHVQAVTEEELVAAAREHVGPRLIVTGAVAARALGLRWVPATRCIHVLVRPENQASSSGLVHVTRTTCFGDLPTWTRHEVRYACPDRAVVDTARGLRTLRDVRGVVLAAVADGRAAPEELRAILDGGQRNGSGLARHAVLDAERGCASPPEAELVDALIGCRQPFYVNPQLWLDGVLLGCPDVWLIGLGIGGEVESKERHGGPAETESTYDRHERITAPGLELVHLSVRRIRVSAPEAAAHLLARARGRLELAVGTREPAGLAVVPCGPLLH